MRCKPFLEIMRNHLSTRYSHPHIYIPRDKLSSSRIVVWKDLAMDLQFHTCMGRLTSIEIYVIKTADAPRNRDCSSSAHDSIVCTVKGFGMTSGGTKTRPVRTVRHPAPVLLSFPCFHAPPRSNYSDCTFHNFQTSKTLHLIPNAVAC
jgi:hypothetical protein